MTEVRLRATRVLALVCGLGWSVGCGPAEERPEGAAPQTAPDALRVAEDLRGVGPDGVAPLLEGLRDAAPARRILAVRALGRLEDPTWADTLRTALSDLDAGVRREAAQALAQAVRASDSASADATGWLVERILEGEQDHRTLGALGRALARLPDTDSPIAPDSVRAVLSSLGERLEEGGDREALISYALGLESHFRVRPQLALGELRDVVERLSAWGRATQDGSEETARVRRLTTGLLGRQDADSEVLIAALADSDGEVRRRALGALAQSQPAELERRLSQLTGDPEPSVRIDALTVWERELKASRGCDPLFFAVRDGDPRVALTALSLLADPCPEAARQRTTLQAIVGELTDSNWHVPTRALFALASVAPGDASRDIQPFVQHPSPFARAWAARAAALMEREDVLRQLTADSDPNVRTAALQGWVGFAGHAVDDELVSALEAEDPQLVLSSVRLLTGSPDGADHVDALFETLERLSAMEMETLRDPRVALVARIGEFGDEGSASALERYLYDPDSVVARTVSEILEGWTGTSWTPTPRGNPSALMPTDERIAQLERIRVLLDLGAGRIGIRLYPEVAPSNVDRFVSMVEAGVLDGLTFHRVVPNFVLQGGSPGANEYAGHGFYTRDEVGSGSHWRGTVGLSTRGRDTADGQIFINLVDNPRLDHDYTIIGEIELGLDVADRVLEGERIERASTIERKAEETPGDTGP